jgi:hypothetical protein
VGRAVAPRSAGLALVSYGLVSGVGVGGSVVWRLRSFFSSFLAFFSRSRFRFSNA